MRRKMLLIGGLPLLSSPFFLYEKEPQLYAWGCNTFGQLGSGHTRSSPLPIALDFSPEQIWAKGPVSCCHSKGNYFLFGRNKQDLFNMHSIDNVLLPTELGEADQVALGHLHMGVVKENKIVLWGSDSHGKLGRAPKRQEGFAHRAHFEV